MHEAFDRLVAAVGLALLSPLLLIVAIMVHRQNGSPVLFRQTRVGRYGRPFTMYKFRTMVQGPSRGPQITVAGDSRVTALGSRLRSTKADELPQLWNVVRGEMSLVGPRPETPVYVERWDPAMRDVILSVRPGITDPMTLDLRREEELLATHDDPEAYYVQHLLPRKTAAYAEYVRSKRFTGDIRILAMTFQKLFRD